MSSVEDTGLNLITISDLVAKVLYFGGLMTGFRVAEIVKLPYTGVVDRTLEFLKREKFVEVKGSGGIGEGAWQYMLSVKGAEKARQALDRSQYASACPVTLAQYIEAMLAQNQTQLSIGPEMLKRALSHLTVTEEMMGRIGPAVNSGRSMFLYGPPGNGKTTIAESVGRMVLGRDIWIPYAVDIDGQTVRVFDDVNHELLETASTAGDTGSLPRATGVRADPRWVRIRRPVIIVGGELTMEGLDLVWDDTNHYYEAPYQMKANGGMLLIDDFGRQQVRPRDLLNRWIVPLEKQVDYLTLHTGRKIEVPFFVLVVFSTNIEPSDLVDEAFLRRIRHKIAVGDPSFEQYRDIFKQVCSQKHVPYDEDVLKYVIKKWYIDAERNLRCVHPRDLIDQIIDISKYTNQPPRMTREMMDRAAAAYFVDL
ncbi:MAG: AAA family ATPase [Anaerolineae bacterium]